MAKFFNIAGHCVPGEHYMLDPMRGTGDDLMRLIDGKQYFLIHAARQSGKTTLLKELTRRLNKQGNYYALYSWRGFNTFCMLSRASFRALLSNIKPETNTS